MRIGRALFPVVVVAVLLRLGSAVYQGNEVAPTPGAHDQVSYDALARRVVEGHGFTFSEGWWPATKAGEPTAHWSYLEVLYLAAVYAVVGFQPVVARLLQALVAGIVQPWLTWRIARRAFGERAALAAALLSAVYGYFVYYAGTLMSETFHILGLLWICDLLTGALAPPDDRQGGRRAMLAWAALGGALAVAVLARQVTLVCVPVLVVWSCWRARAHSVGGTGPRRWEWGRSAGGWAVALAVLALLILPFTVRNHRAFDRFVLLNTNAGFAFFWANHPVHGTSFESIREGPGAYSELIPPELRGLGEAELNSRLLRLGLGFVRDDPVRFLRLSLSRVADYFRFWPSSESSRVSNLVRVGSFGLCLPLMLLGAGLALFRSRREGTPGWGPAGLLLLFGVAYTAIHLASWSLIRYRIPVDAMWIVFAGAGLSELAGRVRERFGEGTPA